ncbi:exonuclease SbcCD subunit D [Bacillus daqingensis]|uniref:Exonuclease SbcCD subunit D n=1 Tax=Bacillus daqingensis TaxID=872396 RepID=A0ABV9NYB8_9BACI
MIRFIHCADLHLDRPVSIPETVPAEQKAALQRSAKVSFSNACETAAAERVDFMLISGDLYHYETRSLSAQRYLRSELEKLARRHIPVYIIHGNHDPVISGRAALPMPENVHVFSEEGERVTLSCREETVHLYGFSYSGSSHPDSPINKLKLQPDNGFHIGLLHGQEAAGAAHDYAPFQLRELKEAGFDYWALGHIHQRSELSKVPPIHYPGSIIGASRKETGAKGVLMVELEADRPPAVTFMETAPFVRENVSIDCTGIETIDELVSACFAGLNTNTLYSIILAGTLSIAGLETSGQVDLHLMLADEAEASGIILDKIFNHTERESEALASDLQHELKLAVNDMKADGSLHQLTKHPVISRHLPDSLKEDELFWQDVWRELISAGGTSK